MNRILPISFGRVIRVHAPENIVQEVANIANNNKSDELSKEIRKVLSNEDNVKYVRPFFVNKDEAYLLSGDDAIYETTCNIKNRNFSQYYYKMVQYVKRNKEDKEMTVAHNGKNVKAIDMTI